MEKAKVDAYLSKKQEQLLKIIKAIWGPGSEAMYDTSEIERKFKKLAEYIKQNTSVQDVRIYVNIAREKENDGTQKVSRKLLSTILKEGFTLPQGTDYVDIDVRAEVKRETYEGKIRKETEEVPLYKLAFNVDIDEVLTEEELRKYFAVEDDESALIFPLSDFENNPILHFEDLNNIAQV